MERGKEIWDDKFGNVHTEELAGGLNLNLAKYKTYRMVAMQQKYSTAIFG